MVELSGVMSRGRNRTFYISFETEQDRDVFIRGVVATQHAMALQDDATRQQQEAEAEAATGGSASDAAVGGGGDAAADNTASSSSASATPRTSVSSAAPSVASAAAAGGADSSSSPADLEEAVSKAAEVDAAVLEDVAVRAKSDATFRARAMSTSAPSQLIQRLTAEPESPSAITTALIVAQLAENNPERAGLLCDKGAVAALVAMAVQPHIVGRSAALHTLAVLSAACNNVAATVTEALSPVELARIIASCLPKEDKKGKEGKEADGTDESKTKDKDTGAEGESGPAASGDGDDASEEVVSAACHLCWALLEPTCGSAEDQGVCRERQMAFIAAGAVPLLTRALPAFRDDVCRSNVARSLAALGAHCSDTETDGEIAAACTAAVDAGVLPTLVTVASSAALPARVQAARALAALSRGCAGRREAAVEAGAAAALLQLVKIGGKDRPGLAAVEALGDVLAPGDDGARIAEQLKAADAVPSVVALLGTDSAPAAVAGCVRLLYAAASADAECVQLILDSDGVAMLAKLKASANPPPHVADLLMLLH